MKRMTLAVAAGAISVAAVLSAAATAKSPEALRPTKITVYEKPNFKGRSMTFERSVPSLAAVKFNDLPASVKIEGKRDWVLCEHRNFFGKCVRIHAKERNLKRLKIAGMVSSLYPVREAPPAKRR